MFASSLLVSGSHSDGKDRLGCWVRLLGASRSIEVVVRFTAAGSDLFRTIAAAHEAWIGEMLAHGGDDEAHHLTAMLTLFAATGTAANDRDDKRGHGRLRA